MTKVKSPWIIKQELCCVLRVDWWRAPLKVNIQFKVNKVNTQFKVNKVNTQFKVNKVNTQFKVNKVNTQFKVNKVKIQCKVNKVKIQFKAWFSLVVRIGDFSFIGDRLGCVFQIEIFRFFRSHRRQSGTLFLSCHTRRKNPKRPRTRKSPILTTSENQV